MTCCRHMARSRRSEARDCLQHPFPFSLLRRQTAEWLPDFDHRPVLSNQLEPPDTTAWSQKGCCIASSVLGALICRYFFCPARAFYCNAISGSPHDCLSTREQPQGDRCHVRNQDQHSEAPRR